MTCSPLAGIRVLLVTSSHEAADHRIRDKEAVSLARAGARVTIIGANSCGAPAGDGIEIVEAPKATARLDRFLRQPWRCCLRARGLKADVVHLHDPELLQIVPWLKLLPGRPRIIYDVHENFPELVRIRSYLPGFCRSLAPPAIDLVEKSLAGLVDAVIAVTPLLAARFGNRLRESLYNFPSRRFYEHALSVSRPPAARRYDLVHLGTLSETRADFLAETLAILRRRKPSFRALITGAHSGIVRQLQTSGREGLAIEGVIPYDLIAARLGDARIGLDVHPFPTSNLRVALPVKVFEYMASGCAVATSAMPVLTGLLNEHPGVARDVRVIDGGEPGDYADSILDLLDRIQMGEEIGARLRIAAAEHYTWEKEAEKMIDLYGRLLRCRQDN